VAEQDPTQPLPRTAPTLPGAGLGSDPDRDLEARLTTWTADARTDERIASRRREQWLRTAAREEATFAGVLVDLAEGGHPVALETRSGRRHTGLVRSVTAEIVQVETGSDGTVLLRTAALVGLRAASPSRTVTGVARPLAHLTLAEAIARFAEDRPRVAVVTAGGGTVSGVLEAVGLDVLVVRPETQHSTTVYVPVDGVDEVTVEPPA
jgi:hypothetical protein